MKEIKYYNSKCDREKHTGIDIFLQGSFWVAWAKSLNENQMFTMYLSYKTYLSQLTLYLAI